MENKLPYRFNDKERKITFNRFDFPSPWINYLSNGKMHAFVSQAGGGMSWWLSPMAFRISRYRFYNLPMDTPGFYIYIRLKDGTVFSPTFTPCSTPVDYREASHAPGYSVFTAFKNGLKATLKLYMAQSVDALIWDLTLKNESGGSVDCDAFAYTELSQFLAKEENTLGYYLKWNTTAEYNRDAEAITYVYTAWMHPRPQDVPMVYFGGDTPADAWCCNRDVFCGNYRDERNPAEVEQGRLSNTNLKGGEPCGALQNRCSLLPGEEKKLHYYLGVTRGGLVDSAKAVVGSAETLAFLRTPGTAEAEFDKNIVWWDEHLGIYQCEIPDEEMMREINIWNPLQCVQTGRFSRAISSSASGVRGIGFRDSAQDFLAQAYRKPEWAIEMLEYLASMQFEDGHPVHIMWPEEKRPAQDITRSDNHLWIVYLAYAIAAETGDITFLDKEIPFLAQDMMGKTGSATLWEHLLRGIDFTGKHMGSHGLPLILYSDWNDHLGPYGRKGKGESIFVSQQLIYALRQLIELAEKRGEHELADRFEKRVAQQEQALEQFAWDGEWYLRGLDDDGNTVGTHDAENARIWINPQSWMVIAGAGDLQKQRTAMESANKLLNTELGILINTPGYPGWPDRKSLMVNGLQAGYSENAGVFVQANCWAIMAEALLGNGDRAWQYYKQVLPQSVIQKIGVERYHSEAYAYCSTILGPENEKFGWGVTSQVTGTAAWMDVISTQYILGVRPTLKGLLIDPSVPGNWTGFTVSRKYRGIQLEISVENPNHAQHGVRSVEINGKEITGNLITDDLLAGLETAQITVIMG